MKISINKKQENICKDLKAICSNSTFLIPQTYMTLFQKKMEKFDWDLQSYLSYLLNKYRFLIRTGIIPKHDYLKTGYQKKELNLKRVDFVPLAEDWAELKCLKTFFNRSMNWIFVFLLLLDDLDLVKNLPKDLADFVVPKVANFRQEVRAIISRKQSLYIRILQVTRDRGKRRGKI
jgi:hypothetical protein